MPNSILSDRPGKRERLVISARETIYHQGVEATTIAEIAEAADVPAGNVYYYFKTKDELISAAIDAYTHRTDEMTSQIEQQHRTPRARLKAFVRALCSQPNEVARYGCPRGSLCSELEKQDNDLARASAELLRGPLVWIEQQFKTMGRRDAHELAFALIASHQGISVLSHTFRDPELLVREGRRLERWIDSLARDAKVTS
jgi:AcrR family transcriptional regulator